MERKKKSKKKRLIMFYLSFLSSLLFSPFFSFFPPRKMRARARSLTYSLHVFAFPYFVFLFTDPYSPDVEGGLLCEKGRRSLQSFECVPFTYTCLNTDE